MKRNEVNKFVKDFVDKFISGKIEKPNLGDCFYCSLRVSGKNMTFGEFNHSDHISFHIREKYYVPSLFLRAMEKNKDKLSILAQCGIGGWLNGQTPKFGLVLELVKKQYKHALERHISSQLLNEKNNK